MKTLLAPALLTLLAAPALAQEETTVTMDEVPPAVMEAATAANTMGSDFTAVSLDDGVYELSGVLEGDMAFEIDVTEDGTVEEIEREITADALPAEVAATLEAELAGFVPDYVEESTCPDGAVVYEFEGTFEGREIDVEIGADGTGFTMNEDMAG